jgi:hypothetical protein
MTINNFYKKLLSIIIILLMISSIAFTQSVNGELRGTVSDSATHLPLPLANVMLCHDTIVIAGNSTDMDGKYVIKPVKPGTYNLVITYIGYKKLIVKDIEIGGNKISFFNASLKVDIPKLNEVVVETYRKPVFDADEASPSLSKADIMKAPTRDVKELVPVSSTWSPKSRSDKESYDMNPGLISLPKSGIIPYEDKILSGILTAGELNDFSKWELWKDVNQGDLKSWQDYWKFKPFERYTVQIISVNGRPLADCEVSLMNKDKKSEWTARTDNTGKAELWVNLFSAGKFNKGYTININYKSQNYKIKKILKFSEGINIITLPAACDMPQKADIMFVVDATGSMSDEIQYLKSELNNIITEVKKQNPNLELNLGSVFYRDKGDAYVTRKSDFSVDINTTINFIKQQSAGGGGDEPEAVHTALNVAIHEMKWSDDAVARLMFLVLDAPPHYSPGIIDSIQVLISEASAKGIRIIPITGSGINKSAEYLMRAFALATNGTYVFLTDHSRVGNSHIKPSTDEYDVQLLKDVLLRILHQYLFIPSCNDKLELTEKGIKDTMYVKNPKIIAHEISDSSLVGKHKNSNIPADTNKVSFVDTTKTDITTDSLANNTDKNQPVFINFRYYPNPTTGKLYIDIEGKIEELYLADISGKLLERYLVKGNEKLEINLSKYPVGVYFLQYFYANKWLTGKVILTR